MLAFFIHNAHGQRTKMKYENGATTTYTYDDDTQRISRIRTTRSSDSAVLQDLNYWYDPVGNITWQSDDAQQDVYYSGTIAVAGNKYTYDALYRLLRCEGREHIGGNVVMGKGDGSRMGFTPLPTDGSAMRPYIQYYSHDAAGNATRTKHTTTGGVGNWTFDYGIDTYSNKLLSWSIGGIVAENYIYDVRGNMLQGPGHLLVSLGGNGLNYNEEGRLEKVITASGTTLNYQYDYQGQRVKTYTSSFTEVRRYVGQWELYQRTAPVSSTVILERETLHVSDVAMRVAIIDTPTINTTGSSEAQTLRYQLGNHLGTASLELDYASQVISYEEYYPFGNTSYQGGRTVAEVGLKRYRYVGKERDAETGFYYIGARYYCPWLCRWLEPDPINNEWYNLCQGKPGRNASRQHVELTASPYEYCYANPVRFSDPSGEQPPDPVWNFENLLHFDMSKAPKTGKTNAAGYTRNGPWVAKQYLLQAPEAFSADNVALINKNKMPIADETWIKHTERFGTSQRTYVNGELIHHHTNQGKMATLVPKQFHVENTKELHPVRNVANHFNNGGKALSLLNMFTDIISYKAGNPDSWVSMFHSAGEKPEIGKVYNDWGRAFGNESNRYFTTTSSKDLGDGQTQYELDVFSSYK